jgi:Na+-driven multidrug efflux pump
LRCWQVDTAFVGQLGVLPLASLGRNAALFNVVFFIGFAAVGVAATNLISAAHGAGNRAAAGRGLIISSVASAVLGARLRLRACISIATDFTRVFLTASTRCA